MIEAQAAQVAWPALLAGLVTSVHCVGMCGPLACFVARRDLTKGKEAVAMGMYHGARLFSYALIGGIAGGLGAAPLSLYSGSAFHILPWFLVVFFLVVGLGWERYVPRPRWAVGWVRKMMGRGAGWHPWVAPFWIGLFTPLLPCGPLYLMFGAALLAGSAGRGAEFAFVFGLGTLPLLWLGQTQWLRWQGRLNPLCMGRVQRGVALCGAIFMAVRLMGGPSLSQIEDRGEINCPLCPSAAVGKP